MDHTNNSSGASSNAARSARPFPESNMGRPLIKVLLDHMKAAIIGCRQEKTGLTKDGKSLVGPIDPLVAQQLLRQGHVGATTSSGGRCHGSGGEGRRRGGFGSPAPPTGRVCAMATVISPTVASTAPGGPTPMEPETGAPAMGRRRTPPGRIRPVRAPRIPSPKEKESREPGDCQARPVAAPRSNACSCTAGGGANFCLPCSAQGRGWRRGFRGHCSHCTADLLCKRC